jgi:hypothetical protein
MSNPTSKKEKAAGWARSGFTTGDMRKLKKTRMLPKAVEIAIPGDEVISHLDVGFRILFVSFLYRGLSLTAHKFLCGLLVVYVMQLHQLTSNSILHIVCFIMLCRSFLGVDPHWGLWKCIFFLHHNPSKDEIHDIGGTIISVHPEAGYFNFKMADSIQGWQTKWFYIKDEKASEAHQFGLAPFDPKKELKKLKSWHQLPTDAELEESGPRMTRISTLQADEKKEMSCVQIIAYFLCLHVQPLQARAS